MLVVLVHVALVVGSDPPFPTPKTLAIGGPRKVTVVIDVDGDDYLLRARMLSIRCFDSATNDRLNTDRARLYALGGLAQALSGAKEARLGFAEATIEKSALDGKFFEVVVRVPRRRVQVFTRPVRAIPFPESITWKSDLLNRKRDHQQTIERLLDGLRDEIKRLPKQRKDDEAFALRVAELEERGIDNFARMKKLIENDLLLLSLEKDHLQRILADKQKAFLAALKYVVDAEVER